VLVGELNAGAGSELVHDAFGCCWFLSGTTHRCHGSGRYPTGA
jgi:hypothetical protein